MNPDNIPSRVPQIIALTPKEDLKPEAGSEFWVYNEHLQKAFQNPNIRNIALSGSLGSGKSSIIRSFDQIRNGNKKRFLYISSMDFSKVSTNTGNNQYDQRELEYSLLNQILSHCTACDLPEGSISGVPEKYPRLRFRSALLSLLSFMVYVLIFHDHFGTLAGMLGISENVQAWMHISFYVLVGVTLACGVYCVSRRCLPFFRLSKLTLKSNVAEAEVSLGKERTTLDAHKFELAYILERIGNKHDYTVVFEDLERLDDSSIAVDIMGKLRELNILTNNHLQAVYDRSENFFSRKMRPAFQPIRFIYAISDSTMPVEYRTKFYDCIIPVVPISHPLNSQDHLLEMLAEFNFGSELEAQLCDALSEVFVDYRTLLSLRNEFSVLWWLHREPFQQDVNNHTHPANSENNATIFALTAYKVLLPEVFEYALSPQGDQILPYYDSKKFRKSLMKHPEYIKVSSAIQKLFASKLLSKSSLRLIAGEQEQVEKWINILRTSLDQDIFSAGNKNRVKQATDVLADAFNKAKSDPSQDPYNDFRIVMTERLHKLTAKEHEAQFILVANSLAAVSRKDVAGDWAWLTPVVPNSTDEEDKKLSAKGIFTRYIQFLVAYQQDSPDDFKDLIVIKEQDLINFCISSLKLMQANDMHKNYNWTDTMGIMLGSITKRQKLPDHLRLLLVTESKKLQDYCSF